MLSMRNEYRDLKKENDLIFSTLAEYDRDAITEILSTVNNTRGLGYEVELVRKDLIAMAAQAETQGKILTDTIGDVESFKLSLLASMPKPTLTDYMADSLVWLATYGFAVSLTYLVLRSPWACYYDAVWLVLCAVVMMPSAWLLQRVVPYSWFSYSWGVRYVIITSALFILWLAEFRLLYRWIYPLLPHVGLPNLLAAVLFGVLLIALRVWRTRRQNAIAEKRPWRDITRA